MQELALEQLDDVGGGITVRQVGLAMALIGIGALAVAVAPVAFGAGLVAASVGLGTSGAISAAGGGYLLSQP